MKKNVYVSAEMLRLKKENKSEKKVLLSVILISFLWIFLLFYAYVLHLYDFLMVLSVMSIIFFSVLGNVFHLSVKTLTSNYERMERIEQ